MLDTVILQLEKKNFSIFEYEKFRTSEKEIININAPFRAWYNNPTAQDRQNGIYKPRLTLTKRGLKINLKIEFSASKLLFGESLNELEENDFNEVVRVLHKKLDEMGVFVWTKDIEETPVLSFHPAKNIILKNNFTVNSVIRELKKIDIGKRFDIDEKNYRNSGESLHFFTISHAFTFYDKIKDLEKAPKRAIDKEQTIQQLSLFDNLKKTKMELLRFEVRLSKKRKMNEVLKKLGYNINPQFKNIFNKKLCKKILNQYWNDYFGDNQFVFCINDNPQKILQIILSKFPKLRLSKALKIVSIFMLCKDEEGTRGFRQIVENYKPETNWNDVKKYLELLNNTILTYPTWQFLNDIKNSLEKFDSLKFDKKDIYLPI
ncbi:MAG: hypothetical protein PHS54_03460 [Clostridia bacterium]|nr:hypothetical protein [Clostridia bacterium]